MEQAGHMRRMRLRVLRNASVLQRCRADRKGVRCGEPVVLRSGETTICAGHVGVRRGDNGAMLLKGRCPVCGGAYTHDAGRWPCASSGPATSEPVTASVRLRR